MKQKKGFLRVDLGFLGLLSLCNCNYVSMYYSILLKSTYTFISFSENFPPIRLFSPILLLDFKKISHLYFYQEPSSIRNSRVRALCLRLQLLETLSLVPSYTCYIVASKQMCSNINEYSGRKPLYDRDSKLKRLQKNPKRWEKEERENNVIKSEILKCSIA